MPYVNARSLREKVEDRAYGLEKTVGWIRESLAAGRRGESGHLATSHFSIRDLFEEFYPNGSDILRCWSRGRSVPAHLLEAADAVSLSAFTEILGQLLVSDVLAAYEAPQFIWPQLCTTKQTILLNGEKIPGIAGLGDVAEAIGEGEEYPTVGLSQEYIETVPLVKRGFVVRLTKEVTLADNTGLFSERAGAGAQFLGVNLEKRVVDAAIGTTNNYKRLGVATNTFLASGAYVNYSSTNQLIDWRSIETSNLMFDALNDPNTGEPIIVNANTLLVPKALEMTALRVVNATEVAQVDNQANSSTIRAFSPNPLAGRGLKVLTSPYVKRRSSSAGRWWHGDFPRMLQKRTAWEITPEEQGQGSYLQFHRDIIREFKVSCMDAVQVVEPRAATQNYT